MLINGKGIPTTGRIPTTMPKFTKIVVTKIKLNPPIVNLQNLSRAADSYSGPLLIWIMAKITNLASIASKHKSPQMYLKNSGVWQSKINDYLSFIKNQTNDDLNSMQKKIYELELSLKGLIKKDFWIELESLICQLGPN